MGNLSKVVWKRSFFFKQFSLNNKAVRKKWLSFSHYSPNNNWELSRHNFPSMEITSFLLFLSTTWFSEPSFRLLGIPCSLQTKRIRFTTRIIGQGTMSNSTKGYIWVISYGENFSHCTEQVSFPTPFSVQSHSHLKRINIFFSVLNLYFSIIIGRVYYRFKSLFKHTLSGQSLGLLMFTKIYTWTMKTTNCPFPLRFHLRTAVLNVNQLNCGWLLSVLCEGGGGEECE